MNPTSEGYTVLYGPTPPPKVCFQVVILYNHANPLNKKIKAENRKLESEPISTYPDALYVAQKHSLKIKNKYNHSQLIEMEEDQIEEDDMDCHFCIVDTNGDLIVKIGIHILDYRNMVIH